jgi:hypothetical protein
VGAQKRLRKKQWPKKTTAKKTTACAKGDSRIEQGSE